MNSRETEFKVVMVRNEERNVLDQLLDTPEDDDLDVEFTRSEKRLKSKRTSSVVKAVNSKECPKLNSSKSKVSKSSKNELQSRHQNQDIKRDSATEVSKKSIKSVANELIKESTSHKKISPKPNNEPTSEMAPKNINNCGEEYSSSHDSSCSCEDHSSIVSNGNRSSHSSSRSISPKNKSGGHRTARSLSPSNRESKKRWRSEADDRRKSKRRRRSSHSQSVGRRDPNSLLRYFFKDSCFFVMKSNNHENVVLSKAKGVWSTPPQNETKLNRAFKEFRNVILIFSVKESGKFQGFARLASESRHDSQPIQWVLPHGLNARALGGVFYLDWICRRELSFTKTLHLFNPFNDGKPVKIARDGQEIDPRVGEELCRLFPSDETVELIPMLKRMKKQTAHRPRSHRIRGPFMDFNERNKPNISSRIDFRNRERPNPVPNHSFPSPQINFQRKRMGQPLPPIGPLGPRRDIRDVVRNERLIQRPLPRREFMVNGNNPNFHRNLAPPMPPFSQRPFIEPPFQQRLDLPPKPRLMDRNHDRNVDEFIRRTYRPPQRDRRYREVRY
ncbi:unnamed protein product [Medioppia subpectinata]|uniref:YTH domain-containing protein n=1 Tax=Medioppia subpectinata TaxID=1979941 RepID=A0A7R9KKJ8_9ACAR|nr:unnamed protein product [Medioppia subpectinata]CAG2105338.1 unnamed protein product [Medioppia subpectinata]